MLDSQIQLGVTYYSMGRTPEAIAEWEAILEKDSSRDEARMYLRLVRGATRQSASSASSTIDLPNDSPGADAKPDHALSGWSQSELAPGPEESTP